MIEKGRRWHLCCFLCWVSVALIVQLGSSFTGRVALQILHSFNDFDGDCTSAKKRIRGGPPAFDTFVSCSVGRHACRSAKNGMAVFEARQAGTCSPSKLEERRQICIAAVVREPRGGLLQEEQRWSLDGLDSCQTHSRAHLVSDRSAGDDGCSRWSTLGATVSRLWTAYGREDQSYGLVAVLWMSALSLVSFYSAIYLCWKANGSGAEDAEGKGGKAVPGVVDQEKQQLWLQDQHRGRWRRDEWQCFATCSEEDSIDRRELRLGDCRGSGQEEDGRADSRGSDTSSGSSQAEAVRTEEELSRAPDRIRQAILARQRRLKRTKLGICRRLLGNCRSLACTSILLASSVASTLSHGLSNSFLSGTHRPDLLEVFAGTAQVSLSFQSWGWWSMEPVNLVYGDDLADECTRERLLQKIDEYAPRLVVVSYPCTLDSQLTNLSCRSSQEKRRLLQKRDPF